MRERLTAGLTIAATLSLFAIVIDASDNYTVSSGATLAVTAHANCRNVTNNSATGASVYVPTQTSAEWQSFYTNPPAGVTLSSCVTPGSRVYSTPGTYTFTVPAHNTMTVELWGGGGGGVGSADGSATQAPNPVGGANGGASRWAGGAPSSRPQANGGTAGDPDASTAGAGGGAGGTGQFCTTATTGQVGGGYLFRSVSSHADPPSGKGGNGAQGGAGGASVTGDFVNGLPGAAPGGGGSGSANRRYMRGVDPRYGFPGGGGGGYCIREYSAGGHAEGSTVTVIVGAGGAGGNSTRDGGSGAAGRVEITWR